MDVRLDLTHEPWATVAPAQFRWIAPGAESTLMQDHWEHFEHGADVGVRGLAATKAGAFEQAALALTAVVTDPARVAAHDTVEIACEAPDDELLLAHWLNAVVSEMATRRMLFSHYEVQLDGHRLRARAIGEPASVQRHQPAVEVKGATCTALRVAALDGGWLAQTVVDV
jgi:tRNA nucleotidyltransferase (CCA-adding enzyme)